MTAIGPSRRTSISAVPAGIEVRSPDRSSASVAPATSGDAQARRDARHVGAVTKDIQGVGIRVGRGDVRIVGVTDHHARRLEALDLQTVADVVVPAEALAAAAAAHIRRDTHGHPFGIPLDMMSNPRDNAA